MEKRTKYNIPCKTSPGLNISEHIKDLVELTAFIDNLGISTTNTRISRYTEYLTRMLNSKPIDGSKIFKNSKGLHFESEANWYLYTLREVHELMWILKGLKKHTPKGIKTKLEQIVSGSDFAALDSNSMSRNTQFELRIASYFCQAGWNVDVSTETDIIATNRKYAFFTECKRIQSFKNINSNLSYANKQLVTRMPRKKYQGKIIVSSIVADITGVAFDHNGLTFAMTNEHSKDEIQKKLIKISESTQKEKLFQTNEKLNQLWLQIHMPSFIIHPITTGTRFSSQLIFRDNTDIRIQKSIRAFKRMFESCSIQDKRCIHSKKLELKNKICIPANTTFSIDEDLLLQYLTQEELPEKKQNDIIGNINMNGKNHEFLFCEFQMLTLNLSISDRRRLLKNINSARLEILVLLYYQRHPYKET